MEQRLIAARLALTLLGFTVQAQPTPPPAPPPVVRLFLLAGQSNMEGHAVVDLDDARDYNGGRGNLVSYLSDLTEPARNERWKRLRTAEGQFTPRDDVFVIYRTESELKAGPLDVGFAVYSDRHHFGPELGIGHVLGDRFDEPIVLIKTCWGGKSLAHDFRPPSAGGELGPCWTQMLAEYRAAVASLATTFPALAHHTPRLDGCVWFQGWNDGCNEADAAEYEENLVHFIGDLRVALGDPRLPFVAGETGNMENAVLRRAQKQACSRPEIGGAARFVPTRAFLRKPEESPNPTHGHHWFGNAGSYLEIGAALGEAMVELREEPADR